MSPPAAARQLPAQITPVGAKSKVCWLVFGASGCGKTTLAGSAPRTLIMRPPTDHTDSLAAGSAQEWVLSDWSDMNEALEYMRHDGSKEFDWVWLDSLSLFQDHGLDDIWADVIELKPARAQHGLDKGEYGTNMFRLGQWVRHMVGHPGFNFGITAHPAELTDEDGDPVLMPWVQGRNMAPKICGYMNLVTYLQVKRTSAGQEARYLYSRPFARGGQAAPIYAKDQYGALKDGRMLNPTVPKVMAAIGQQKTARPKRAAT